MSGEIFTLQTLINLGGESVFQKTLETEGVLSSGNQKYKIKEERPNVSIVPLAKKEMSLRCSWQGRMSEKDLSVIRVDNKLTQEPEH